MPESHRPGRPVVPARVPGTPAAIRESVNGLEASSSGDRSAPGQPGFFTRIDLCKKGLHHVACILKAIAVGPNSADNPVVPPGYIIALGGAIDVGYDSTGPATISHSAFAGNQALGGSAGASAGGGALSNSSIGGATMTVTGCTLFGNAAIGEAGGDGSINFGSGQGGGINDFSSLTVRNSTLTDNLALGTPLAPGAVPSQTVSSGRAVAGGGIFCIPLTVPTATVVVADSTLVGNHAKGGAGRPAAPAVSRKGAVSP